MNAVGDFLRDLPRDASTLARVQQWIEQSQSETASHVNDSEIADLRISGEEPGLNHPPPLVPLISGASLQNTAREVCGEMDSDSLQNTARQATDSVSHRSTASHASQGVSNWNTNRQTLGAMNSDSHQNTAGPALQPCESSTPSGTIRRMVQGGPEEPDPKRPHYEPSAEDAGSVAGTVCSIGSHASHSGPFDPAALVKSKEGSFKPPEELTTFMSKHFKRCLKKEEREAMFKDHPRPDISAATVPKADKYITDFLGKRFPKDQDAELMKVQAAVLGITRPLASAWKELHEARATKDASATVPAAEVMHLIQRTLCLVGNASEYISQTRRAHILEHIDKSWSRYASDEFPDAEETLFGDAFKSSLSERVEKDTALAKAVSITKKRQKEVSSDSDRKGGGKDGQFFRPGPPARYGDRQGRFQTPYSQPHYSQRGKFNPRRGGTYFQAVPYRSQPQYQLQERRSQSYQMPSTSQSKVQQKKF